VLVVDSVEEAVVTAVVVAEVVEDAVDARTRRRSGEFGYQEQASERLDGRMLQLPPAGLEDWMNCRWN